MLKCSTPRLGRYTKERTNKYFFTARSTAFFSRVPITRIQRSTALDYIKQGRLRPWYYTKEQVVGSPVTLNFDYQPRPVRLVGTVMDSFCHQSSLRGGVKVVSRTDETNVSLWVPFGNPKLKYDMTVSSGAFDHYMDERDKWDEAWITGRARLK
jgi:hypothetical protein